jgi:DNA-binding protein HU-beta
MNKSQLIDEIAAKTKLTKKECGIVLDAAINAVMDAVAEGERVTLVGFGSFEAKERGERVGRNPRSGESITIAATSVPTFSAGKEFKDKVKSVGRAV